MRPNDVGISILSLLIDSSPNNIFLYLQYSITLILILIDFYSAHIMTSLNRIFINVSGFKKKNIHINYIYILFSIIKKGSVMGSRKVSFTINKFESIFMDNKETYIIII